MTDQCIPFTPAHFRRRNNVLTEQIKSVDFPLKTMEIFAF